MAASSELSSFAVGEISQLLSAKRKRKSKADGTTDLTSLFGSGSVQKPMFVAVVEKPKKTDVVASGVSDAQHHKKKRKTDDTQTADECNTDSSIGNTDIHLCDNKEAASNRINKKRPSKTEEDPERLARTIFVGNLPVTLKKKAFKKHFSKYGEVESVRFRSAALAKPNLSRSVGMKRKEFHKDRHTINGYVVFKAADSTRQALQSNGEEMDGMHIRVDLADNAKSHDHSRSVFVGNLPFDVEVEPVRMLFSSCGEVESVRLIRDSMTGIGKGFGYVLFKNKDDIVFALKMNNRAEFKGRKIRVFPSKDKPRTDHVQKVRKAKPQSHSFSGIKATKQTRELMRKKGKHKSSNQAGSKFMGRSKIRSKGSSKRTMENQGTSMKDNINAENCRKRLKGSDTRRAHAFKDRKRNSKKKKTKK